VQLPKARLYRELARRVKVAKTIGLAAAGHGLIGIEQLRGYNLGILRESAV
jgi:hypothetical protein